METIKLNDAQKKSRRGRNIALGGVQNAKGHFDLVCREPDIFTDNRQIMDRGKIIAPEPVLY